MSRRKALGLMAAGAAVVGGAPVAGARPAPESVAPLGDEFLWGVGMSGYQAEGHTPDSNQTRYMGRRNPELLQYPDSADFYTRYASDIDLLAGLGAGVFRLSIEWARVQPSPDGWSKDGFDFYDRVLARLADKGIRPMLVLDQWVYPGWVADRGGWRTDDIVDLWLANARKVVERYASHDPLWISFFEPFNYIKYEWRDGDLDTAQIPDMNRRIGRAHNAIYDHIHQRQPGAMVTMSTAFWSDVVEGFTNPSLTAEIGDRLDYVGIGTYYTPTLDLLTKNPLSWSSPDVWSIQPESIYYALTYYARQYPGKPIYVVESALYSFDGAPRPDGYARADHLRDTVYWLQRAKADGAEVIGYNYWSLTDSFEWDGYNPRMGIYQVDIRTDPTLTRHPTDVAEAYRTVVREHGVHAHYRPVRAPQSCSFQDLPDSCTDPVAVPN
ncbi:family 1 glycosylhydrolase [Nocardia sp. NPDC101769]|uniref:family 1 glycosylhydrolase n=1 Tax=Nocardia sp. NPDC101769 TaxID=3364333 RepID=UPI0037F59C74